MFHVELRQFPHNTCRFNMAENELKALVVPWAHGEWVEMGERKWTPHQAKLTVLEGPRLAMEELRMGRGWRAAQRQGDDVTERVLEAARVAGAAGTRARDVSSESEIAGEVTGVELLSLLGEDARALLDAWRQLRARDPERSPSESLAAAEAVVRSAGASPD